MSNVKDFFGATVRPPKAVYGTVSNGSAGYLPMTVNVAGEYIYVPLNINNNLTHYDPDGVINWDVTPTDILTATTGSPAIAGYWWDITESRLYVLAIEVLTGATDRAQFAWINLTTGAVTKLNSEFTLTHSMFDTTYGGLFRASQGSGDFTYRSVNSGQLNEAVIPSIGGSVTETLDIRLNGRPINTSVSYKTPNGNYAGYLFYDMNYSGNSRINLAGQNGQDETMLGVPVMGVVNNNAAKIIQWGGDVAFVGLASSPFYGPQLFDKRDFDRFIDELAELNGVA